MIILMFYFDIINPFEKTHFEQITQLQITEIRG